MSQSIPSRYESKYADFIQLCADAKARGVKHVIVAKPWVLGDTYEEIIESMSRLADANLAVVISGR